MSKVYLCGPITGLSYEQATYNWRASIKPLIEQDPDYARENAGRYRVTGIQCISPMRGKNYLANQNKLDGGKTMYKDSTTATPKSIVGRDRFDVMKNCDVMVANLLGAERVSIGSVVEFGWADAARIPIITIIEQDGSNIHEHAFIYELSTHIVHNIEDAAFVVRTLLTAGID